MKYDSQWASELCRKVSWREAEGVLVVKALDVPREYSETGSLALRLVFRGGVCEAAEISSGELQGEYVLEGRFEDLEKVVSGSLSPFAAFALGKIRLVKGDLSRLADYMPLALEIVRKAREIK